MPLSDKASRRGVLRALGATGAAIAGVGTAAGRPTTGGGPPEGKAPGRTELTILHDTHVHGRFGDAESYENVEYYFGLMNHLADESEYAMRLGNGDDLGSSALSTEFQGSHIVEAFDASCLTHDTYGNHDFDFGPSVLRERVAETGNFQWVSANVEDRRTGEVFGAEEGARRFDVVEIEKVPVGITGVLTTRARDVSNLGENAEVIDPVEALNEVVPEMCAAGARVVIVLSHVANDVAREIARNVDDVDVIVGDDAAEVLGAEEIGETVLAFVGDGYDHLGEMTLDLRGKHVHDYDFTMYDTSEAVPALDVEPDADVQAVADSYRSQVSAEIIGRTDVRLNCLTGDLRTEETNMGNFVADAVRDATGADVALQNGGGIRTDTLYPRGELTDLTVRQILPFGNSVVELEVTGATLLEALENGVSEVDTLEGRFPQVSGMSFTWDPDAEAGDRIVSAAVGGTAVDPDATYTLGTNDFLAGGGDAYDMLTGATQVETGDGLAETIIDRIEQLTPIAPTVEGRIERGSGGSDGETASLGTVGGLRG